MERNNVREFTEGPFSEKQDRDDVSNKRLSTSIVDFAKNECDQHASESLSTELRQEEECKVEIENDVLCKYEPELGKQEAHDEGTECCEQTERGQDGADVGQEASDLDTSTFANTCSLKDQNNRDLMRQDGGQSSSHQDVFVCFICHYSVTIKGWLTRHMQTHHKTTAECSVGSTVHTGPTQLYECLHCDFTAMSQYYLRRHFQQLHTSDPKLYRCPDCSFTTKRRDYLSKHVAVNHSGDALLYRCADCNFTTKCKGNLTKHVRTQHKWQVGGTVTASIKQETTPHVECSAAARQDCSEHSTASLTKVERKDVHQCSASLNTGDGSENEYRDDVHNKHSPLITDFAQSECDQRVSESCSPVTTPAISMSATTTKQESGQDEECKVEIEDHVPCKYDVGTDCCKQTQRGQDGADFGEDTGKQDFSTFANTCNFNDQNKTQLMRQTGSHAEVFTCFRCNYSTRQKAWLTRHMNRHNGTAPPRKQYRCTQCNFTTKWRGSFTKHVRAMHSPDGGAVHRCRECDFTTKWRGYLSKHVTAKHRNAPLHRCGQCEYTTRWKDSLPKHVMAQHSPDAPRHRCPACNYTTKHKEYLTKHVEAIHSADAPLYRCAECDYATRWRGALPKHARAKHDADAPPHRCSECAFTTRWRHDLTKHVRLKHRPDAPVHGCAQCDFTSKFKSNLMKHSKSQHGGSAELYGCTYCDFATSRKKTLAHHSKVQHGPNVRPYKCTGCDFTTRYGGSLTRHMRAAHALEGPVFQCAECSFDTRRRGALASHFRLCH